MKHEVKKLEELLEGFKKLKHELENAKVKIVDGKVRIELKEENSSQTNTDQSPSETEK